MILERKMAVLFNKSTAILRLDPVTVIGTMRGTQWGEIRKCTVVTPPNFQQPSHAHARTLGRCL